jgi:hypothetical protein
MNQTQSLIMLETKHVIINQLCFLNRFLLFGIDNAKKLWENEKILRFNWKYSPPPHFSTSHYASTRRIIQFKKDENFSFYMI